MDIFKIYYFPNNYKQDLIFLKTEHFFGQFGQVDSMELLWNPPDFPTFATEIQPEWPLIRECDVNPRVQNFCIYSVL